MVPPARLWVFSTAMALVVNLRGHRGLGPGGGLLQHPARAGLVG